MVGAMLGSNGSRPWEEEVGGEPVFFGRRQSWEVTNVGWERSV